MTDDLYGKVLSVETQNLGEPASAAAAIGATVLAVDDAATFDELGGDVTINGDVLSFVATDVSADTLTMTAPLVTAVAEGDYVEVYPPSPIKTALVDLGDNSDPLPAVVPLNLLDRLPDGTREPGRQETVALDRRGTYEYVVTDVTAEPVISQTLNFADAESGIELSESLAQFQDANVRGSLAVTDLSAESLTLGGASLVDSLSAFPSGKLLSARLPQQGAALSVTTTTAKLFELNCGTVKGGRTYRIVTSLLLTGTDGALTDRVQFLYRYTTDGSAPTVSSPVMDNGFADNSFLPGNLKRVSPESEVDISADCPLRIGLWGLVVSGAGSYSIFAGAQTFSRPQMTLYDDGPSGVRNDAAITLAGGGTTRFTKTFNALWAWGADAAGNLFVDSYGYIGDDPYGEGGLILFVGFDSAAIVAALSGLTTGVSCALRWKPRTRKTATGLDVRIMTHNFASRAAATTEWGFPMADPAHGSTTLTSRGTANNAVPGTSYDFALGTSVLSALKAGTIKGVAFTNSATASNGYGVLQPDGTGSIYGNGASECQLICTYDGTS